MSIAGIDITLQRVSDAATSINNTNKSLNDSLKEVKKEMDSLNQSWQSEAATTISGKFKALEPAFENHFQVIAAYTAFLNKTVELYTEVETKNNSNAGMFK
ncbi:pore-forming ESAT-6 family protein [Paenibacillus sp. L3-i20]|uniref:pore-forming ESAT-6 family protein n=1 Tax=Paenibacillus sp. L3-i20 TaxID=2905833 RepID=UPI001EDE5C67|nr:pore-forming ESAT-6 family protein [Paenibacillus sp. L3-i20]GKU77586.1 hypothetical protein L3i20_v219830 [Paenibacillus sp. L3-i20]